MDDITSGRERVSLRYDAVLDFATLWYCGSVAYDASDEIAALLHGHVVHYDAVGEANLFLNQATGAEDGILERGLVRDGRSFTHKALGADLRSWSDVGGGMDVDGLSVGRHGRPEASHLSVQLAIAVQRVGPVARASLLDESVTPAYRQS